MELCEPKRSSLGEGDLRSRLRRFDRSHGMGQVSTNGKSLNDVDFLWVSVPSANNNIFLIGQNKVFTVLDVAHCQLFLALISGNAVMIAFHFKLNPPGPFFYSGKKIGFFCQRLAPFFCRTSRLSH